jgi:hypothetical protein
LSRFILIETILIDFCNNSVIIDVFVWLDSLVTVDNLFAILLSAPKLALTCQNLMGQRPGFNTTIQDDIWQVGRLPDQHYVVLVPAGSQRSYPNQTSAQTMLDKLKQCSSDMFLIESRLGNYIQAGTFYRRIEAEDLSQVLRCEGFDARVVYFR